MGVFTTIGNTFETAISGFAETTSAGMIGLIFPLVTIAVTLYFTITGYLFMAGRTQDSLPDLMIKGTKIWLVAMVGLNTGNFVRYAIAIQGLEADFIGAMGGSGTSFAVLDRLWEKSLDSISQLLTFTGRLNITSIGAIFLALIIILIIAACFAFLCSLACGILLLAKCALVIVLGFGPLFVCALMFPITRSWFDGWLRSALTYIFTITIATAVILIFIHVLDNQVTKLNNTLSGLASTTNGALDDCFVATIIICITSLVSGYILRAVPQIAASLVGGVAIGAVSLAQMAGSPFSGLARNTKAAINTAGSYTRAPAAAARGAVAAGQATVAAGKATGRAAVAAGRAIVRAGRAINRNSFL